MRPTNTPESKLVQTSAAEQSEMSAEVRLLQEGATLIDTINKLAVAERSTRVSPLDVVLRRREKLQRKKQRKVFGGSKILYTNPEITSKEGYSRAVGLTVARTISDDAFERERAKVAKLGQPKRDYLDPGTVEYHRRINNLSLRTSIELGDQTPQDVSVSVTTCSQINPGNPFGARLLEGPFYDVDVFRGHAYDERLPMFHMRVNAGDTSLRQFVGFDETGDELADESPDFMHADVLGQVNQEIEADLDLLTRGRPVDVNQHNSYLFYSDRFYRAK